TTAITGDAERLAALNQQATELGFAVEDIILAQATAGAERSAVQSQLLEQINEYNRQLEEGTYTDGTRLTLLEGYYAEYQKLNGEQATAVQQAAVQQSINER